MEMMEEAEDELEEDENVDSCMEVPDIKDVTDKGQDSGTNLGWINFMSIIKEKEKEMGMVDDDDNNNGERVERAGGADWELANDNPNQPKWTDPLLHKNKCPYCDKVKLNTTSTHNWQRHLNARHCFKCNKCAKYFTRHQQLTDHIKKCNV